MPSSLGCCHRHELKRVKPAESGESLDGGVLGPLGWDSSGTVVPAEPGREFTPSGLEELSLKLNANGLLQRAKRAHFFGSDESQRVPG